MNKRCKRVFSALLAVLLLVGAAPAAGLCAGMDGLCVTAAAESSFGTCGENVTWSLDAATGTLTVSGTGDMDNYADFGFDVPWFSYHSVVKTVQIGSGVTSIGDWAFVWCERLVHVTVPDSVTRIGEGTFAYCDSLASITIPDSVTNIGETAFLNVCNVDYHGSASGAPWGAKIVNGYVEDAMVFDSAEKKELLVCSRDKQGVAVIPNSVTSIGESAFSQCESLTGVVIPNSVTTIGYYAFAGCRRISSVTIGSGVTGIGEKAFSGCDSLAAYKVDANNASFSSDENGVLYNKDKTVLLLYPMGNDRTDFAIPIGVTKIDTYAFENSRHLASVTIPDGVKRVGEYTFGNCVSLVSVTLPDSLDSIGEGAFYACISLTSVTIPDGVERVWESAFYHCISLASVTIGSGMERIATFAFRLHLDEDEVHYLRREYNSAQLSGETEIDGIPLSAIQKMLDHPNSSLTDVHYHGAEAGWKKIRFFDGNEDLLHANVHYVRPTIEIRNFKANMTVGYRASVTFTADSAYPVNSAYIHWFINGKDVGAGDSYTRKEAEKTFTVQAKYIIGGKTVAESQTETVNVRAGIFARLIAFLRGLFGRLPVVVQEYVGIEGN